MKTGLNNHARIPLGQMAIHARLDLATPPPAVQSYLVSGGRHTRLSDNYTEEFYPQSYRTENTLLANLSFAFRHEPFDMLVIYAALQAIGETALTDCIRSEPTGAFSRRLWFLYETFSGRTLDLEPAGRGNYVDALDPKRHYTAAPINSPRHRVRDNMLGSSKLCPIIRRTSKLEAMAASQLQQEAQLLTNRYSPEKIARAVNFLYTKETRSSFAIEGETPGKNREERFLQAMHKVASFDPGDKEALIRLQGIIVDPRYAASDWRELQNFVGETTSRFGEYVHFISPRPQDVPSLMDGWMAMTERLRLSPLDPVVAAAASAFAFVFIHPFEDGNGRLHRFLIQALLSQKGFSPAGVIFPVSAAIMRKRQLYDQTLEAFSRPIMAAIEWDFNEDHSISVKNDTRDLYRFFDATAQAEFLYERVAETIRIDFKEELEFIDIYDAAFTGVRKIVDMPDRRASLFVRQCLQNGGRLSQNKRKQFTELSDEEIGEMEGAVCRAMQGTDETSLDG